VKDDQLPLWSVHYRGVLSGLRQAEFVRATSAREARKQFEAVRPLSRVTSVKPVTRIKEDK
jgi:hypothetical protein